MPKKKAKKTTKKKVGCNCVKDVNKQLEEHNTVLRTEMLYDKKTGKMRVSGPVIETHKLETKSRKSKITIFTLYCPFCGVKLKKEKA